MSPARAGERGRGAGAVKATGSYEGSLPMEGTSGQGKRLSSRSGAEAGLGGSLTLRLAREGAPTASARVRGDRGVRGSITHGHHGSNMPMLAPLHEGEVRVRSTIRRSGSGVVKRPSPWSCRAEPETPRGFPAVKAAAASRERARCGYTPRFRWQMSVGRVARLGRREIARSRGGSCRALAGRKPEAPLTTGTGRDKAKRCARSSRNPTQERARSSA